jgi:TRAP-type C4-dicarboxylate transport system substrate-binding protein
MGKNLIAAGMLVAGLAGAQAAAAQVVLTASSWVPPSHLLSQAQAAWCEDVAKATENRVTCKILPKPVAPPPQTFDAVRDGLVDLAYNVHGYTPGRYKLTQMAELPFLGDSAVATSVAYQRIYEKYLAKFDEHRGLKVLNVFTHGPGMIFNTKRPIARMSDLDGLKIRVGGGMVNEVAKAMGVNATLKPAPQSYELLSSGVMDGLFFPAESVKSFKLEKLVKHRTEFEGGLYNTSFAFVMNPDTWNRIPKKDQAIIESLSGEKAAAHYGKFWEADDRRSLAMQQAEGIQGIEADAAFVADVRKRTAGLEKAWIDLAKKQGLEDPAKVLAEFRAEIAKLQ